MINQRVWQQISAAEGSTVPKKSGLTVRPSAHSRAANLACCLWCNSGLQQWVEHSLEHLNWHCRHCCACMVLEQVTFTRLNR